MNETTDIDYRRRLRVWLSSPIIDSDAIPGGGSLLVVGCGTMGRQIAQLAHAQRPTLGLFDEDESRAANLAAELSSSGGGTAQVYGELSDLRQAEYRLAIETIIEQVAAKQQLLKQLEGLLSSDCLLTTNTSTLALEGWPRTWPIRSDWSECTFCCQFWIVS